MATKPPDLTSLMECPICLSECDDPRVLPCLHTLCLKCLDQHINTSAEGNHFFCPSCRHKCDVPAGGSTSVPKNFFLNSLKAIIEEQKLRKEVSAFPQFSKLQVDQQECSNSGRDDDRCGKATVFCIECAKFYGLGCQSSHRKFEELSNHQLVLVANPNADYIIKAALSRRRTPRCDQHPSLPTYMYCDTCRVPVCMKCCVLKHKQHQYREIEEAGKESKNLLSNLTQIAKKISRRLDEHMRGLDASEKVINANCDKVSRQVRENAEEIRALVTEREDSMVQRISQAQTSSLSQLKVASKEAEINNAKLFVGWTDKTHIPTVSIYKWPFVSPPSLPAGRTSLTEYTLSVKLNKF